jgi:hypothetical protein
MNNIAVYDAMRFDIKAEEMVWTQKVGTPEAILRDGFFIGGELRYCSAKDLNERGYAFEGEN